MEKSSWLAGSLKGTERGTVFEGEEWVARLYKCMTDDEVKKIIRDRFGGRFEYNNGGLCQRGEASWEEKYGLLTLFSGTFHLMYMPVGAGDFEEKDRVYYQNKITEMVAQGRVYARMKWISEDKIELMNCIERGYSGDEDGFGVEPDTWMTGCFDREGKLQEQYEIYK